MKRAIFPLLALVTILPATAATNLIINGSFESGTLGDNNLDSVSGGTASIDNWIAIYGGSGIAYYQGVAGTASDGMRFAYFNGGGGGGGSYISQSFTAIPSHEYTVLFDAYALGSFQADVGFRASIITDNDQLNEVTGSDYHTSSSNLDLRLLASYETYSFTFTAPSADLLMRFTDITGTNTGSSTDFIIDNVRVFAVPSHPPPCSSSLAR